MRDARAAAVGHAIAVNAAGQMMSERSATVRAGASTRRPGAVGVGVLVALLAVASLTSTARAQGASAVVEGAARVNVRRGPGANFPTVATIGAGERVDVEGMEGEWAHIRTASGETGYVRSVFLAPRGERSGAAAPTARSARETPPRHAADAGGGAAGAGVEASPSARPSGVPGATAAAPAPLAHQTGETDAEAARRLQAELTRVTAALEALQRQVQARGTESAPLPGGAQGGGTAVDPGEPFGAGALGVAVVALLVGWVVGIGVGRRRERNRRSRIRF